MALSNLEGSTIGGLDEGRGHNARILAFTGSLDLTNVDGGAVVHAVDMNGVVTSSASDISTLTVTQGSGLTLEVPVLAEDNGYGEVFTLTFGTASTSAVTASSQVFTIQTAVVNVTVSDGGTKYAAPASVTGISGDQLQFVIGDWTNEGGSLVFANGDDLEFNVIAFAIPAN